MIKSFVSAAIVLGICVVGAPPVGAADCGLLALLSPCSVPLPTPPVPVTVPVPLPAIEAVPAPLPVSPPTPVPAPAASAGHRVAVPEAAERIFQLVNQERAGARLPALTASPRNASIAAGHSMAMAERHDIWHNDAYMGTANRRALGATALGENVAMNGTIDDAHRRLMASPGHRAYILRPGFDAVGMAVVRDETGVLYVTQDFADWQGEPGTAPAAKPVAAKPVAAKSVAAKPAAAKSTAAKPAPRPSGPAVVLRTAAVAPAAANEPMFVPDLSSPPVPSSPADVTAKRSATLVASAPTGTAMVVLGTLVALGLLGAVGVAAARVRPNVASSR